MISMQDVDKLDAQQMRGAMRSMLKQMERHSREIVFKQAIIDKLTHENAVLKRLKFAAQSERFNAEQRDLLEETLDADLEAVWREIEALTPAAPATSERRQPKRAPLPAALPRREIRHEPESTTCACGCQMTRIGEDIAEKLDYVPGVFTVERHVRGKWACAKCETIVQAPVAAHVIDKGIPTAGLLAQVLVAKYVDHRVLRTRPPMLRWKRCFTKDEGRQPNPARSAARSRSSGQLTRWPTTAMGTRRDAPGPSERPARGPLVRTCSLVHGSIFSRVGASAKPGAIESC